MNILAVDTPAVKEVTPFVTIRRHGTGLWQPLYVDSRGAQMLRIFIRSNNRASVEFATRLYAEKYGLEWKDPELPKPQPHMIVVCSWCGKTMGTKPCPPEQDGQVTHGICDECYKKKLDELKADGAPDDLANAFADFAQHGVRYAVGFDEIEEGVREYTDWRG